MGIFKLKKKIYRHKSPIFKKDVDIKKALVSNKISSCEKNYKYFIGYLYNDHKVKASHIMLPETYVKGLMGKLNGCTFLFKMMAY